MPSFWSAGVYSYAVCLFNLCTANRSFADNFPSRFLEKKRKRAMPVCGARHSVQREELNYYVEIMP